MKTSLTLPTTSTRLEDIEVINTELALADLATVEKQLAKYSKQARSGGDKEALKLVKVLEKLQPALNENQPARSVELTPEEKEVIKPPLPSDNETDYVRCQR